MNSSPFFSRLEIIIARDFSGHPALLTHINLEKEESVLLEAQGVMREETALNKEQPSFFLTISTSFSLGPPEAPPPSPPLG